MDSNANENVPSIIYYKIYKRLKHCLEILGNKSKFTGTGLLFLEYS